MRLGMLCSIVWSVSEVLRVALLDLYLSEVVLRKGDGQVGVWLAELCWFQKQQSSNVLYAMWFYYYPVFACSGVQSRTSPQAR